MERDTPALTTIGSSFCHWGNYKWEQSGLWLPCVQGWQSQTTVLGETQWSGRPISLYFKTAVLPSFSPMDSLPAEVFFLSYYLTPQTLGNISHWGNAYEHSQSWRQIRRNAVLWGRCQEWPVIAWLKNNLKAWSQTHTHAHTRTYTRTHTHTHSNIMKRWYVFGRKHRSVLCILLAVTDGFKHDVLLCV